MPPPARIGKKTGVIVLLVGPTGAGKSHFINVAGGPSRNFNASSRDDLSGEDSEVQHFIIPNPSGTPGQDVILVDTPGFDNFHNTASNFDIIKRISDWLKDKCMNDARVGGIIFLHNIREERAASYTSPGSWPISYLASPELTKRLVFTTSKWDINTKQDFDGQEKKLKETKGWSAMLKKGATLCRFENTHDSAWNALKPLLENRCVRADMLRENLNQIDVKLREAMPKPRQTFLKRMGGFFSKMFG